MVKNPPANAGDERDVSSFPGSGRSPGAGNGNPLQYSCLGNPMDRRIWWGRKESDMTELLNKLYIKYVTNKDPLYSVGDYAQYFVITYKRM